MHHLARVEWQEDVSILVTPDRSGGLAIRTHNGDIWMPSATEAA
jgi:hypothetical protein